MLYGRDAQPDILSKTPLHRELRIAEGLVAAQRDAILECIEAGKYDRAMRQAYAEWCWDARRMMNANRKIARQLRNQIAQQEMHDNLFAQAAE